MPKEPIHKHFKTPLSEWIKKIPNELPIDAVGLWQIIPVMHYDFELEGEELVLAVRRSLEALFAAGARPVVGCREKEYDWQLKYNYGDTPEVMIENVIKEWLQSGRDPDPGDIWFAIPDQYVKK